MGTTQSKKEEPKTEKLKHYLENEVLTSIYPPPSTESIKMKSRKPIKPAPQLAQRIELKAQPVEGHIENIVNTFDGRSQVLATAKWPFSVHGVVAVKFDGIDGTSWGTGILIGPNIVLTAGHNLYNHDVKDYAKNESMQFLPGIDGQVLPFGAVKVEKSFVSPNYVSDKKEDYGILILKQPIGEKTGYFGLVCPNPQEIQRKTINIIGFPGDKVKSKPKTYEMWGMESSSFHIDETQGYINYPIDTAAGQSGSGVWYQEGEEYYVCGIHVNGYAAYSQGTLLTKKIYEQIYTWIQQEVLSKELLLKLGEEKKLEFKHNSIDVDCVSLLLGYNLDDITILELGFQDFGEEGTKILAQNNSWVRLRQLYLRWNNLNVEGTKALAQNIYWTNLSQLNLSFNNLGPEGAKALAENTSWINLSQLDLYDNGIGPEGAEALAQNTSWKNLSQLDLGKNNLGSNGAAALAQNTSWINLSRLNLSFNSIKSEGVKALSNNTSWTSLSELNLRENFIVKAGLLAQNKSWTRLSWLDLSKNCISPYEGEKLAKNVSWVNLSRLDLLGNLLGPDGVEALAENSSWTKLSRLDLGNNYINSNGVKALLRNTSWVNLIWLDLSDNNINTEKAKELMKQAPWPNLSHSYVNKSLITSRGDKKHSKTDWSKVRNWFLLLLLLGILDRIFVNLIEIPCKFVFKSRKDVVNTLLCLKRWGEGQLDAED